MLDRLRQRAELIEAVSAVTRTMTSGEIVERLGAVKVNVAKVNNVGEAADDPQLAAIGGVVEFDADGRPVKAVASPFNLFGTPAAVDRPPPELGAAYRRDPARARISTRTRRRAARAGRVRRGAREEECVRQAPQLFAISFTASASPGTA